MSQGHHFGPRGGSGSVEDQRDIFRFSKTALG